MAMSYQEIIVELFNRSGLSQKDYVKKLKGAISEHHLSQIITGKEPGSYKYVRAAMELAKIRVEDCILALPEEVEKDQEAEIAEIHARVERVIHLGKRKGLLALLKSMAPDSVRTDKPRKGQT